MYDIQSLEALASHLFTNQIRCKILHTRLEGYIATCLAKHWVNRFLYYRIFAVPSTSYRSIRLQLLGSSWLCRT